MSENKYLVPGTLLETMTVAAVDVIVISGSGTDRGVIDLLKKSGEVIQKTFRLDLKLLAREQAYIDVELAAADKELEELENIPGLLPRERVLKHGNGEETIDLIWALFEAATLASAQDDRRVLLDAAHFFADFWRLEDEIGA